MAREIFEHRAMPTLTRQSDAPGWTPSLLHEVVINREPNVQALAESERDRIEIALTLNSMPPRLARKLIAAISAAAIKNY